MWFLILYLLGRLMMGLVVVMAYLFVASIWLSLLTCAALVAFAREVIRK